MANSKIEAIKQELRAVIASVKGKTLSLEQKQRLTNLINRAADRIEQLRQEEEEVAVEQPSLQQAPHTQAPMGADLLWILSGGNPEAFVSYLRTVPDPSLNAILQRPEILNSLIQRFQTEMPQGIKPVEDGVEKSDLQSSNVWGSRYDPRSGRLRVKFNEGQVYEYQGVPPMIAKLFQAGAASAKTNGKNRFGAWWVGKNPSAGASVHQYLKAGGYPYQRVK